MVRDGATTMHDGVATEGVPTKYGLLGNGIFLDLIPSYTATDGVKVYINRQAHYFTSTDTTAVAGIDGLCHDFLLFHASYNGWARNKGIPNAERIYRDLQVATDKLKGRYKIKERNVINKMTPHIENTR